MKELNGNILKLGRELGRNGYIDDIGRLSIWDKIMLHLGTAIERFSSTNGV